MADRAAVLEAIAAAARGTPAGQWIWGLGYRAWIEDESEDLGKTMSALDKGLARADSLARWLQGLRRGRAGRPTEGDAA